MKMYQTILDFFQNNECGGAGNQITGWPLMTSVAWPLGVIIVYLSIVCYFGPRFMINRFPYDLDRLTNVLNMSLGFINTVLGCSLTTFMVLLKYNVLCQPVAVICSNNITDRNNFYENIMAKLLWGFLLSKIFQLYDGFVAVLKHREVPPGHHIHHCSMILLTWIVIRFAPGGTTAIVGVISCITHVLVLAYHTFTRRLPMDHQWPRFYTVTKNLQNIQFVLIGMVAVSSFYMDCKYPTWISLLIGISTFIFGSLINLDHYCNNNAGPRTR